MSTVQASRFRLQKRAEGWRRAGSAGGHHPAGYLLESIINPNSVVVEGRGYTGPDGRSIMPDYSGRLSVSELIDLVAYLRSR